MTSHADVRRARIEKIAATLAKAKEKGKEVSEDKLIGECCMEWGCKISTVKEYIKIARMANG